MKIVILIYQIIQEKFAYGELFMLVMTGYVFMFKMVKKMQNSGLEMVGGLTRPLKQVSIFRSVELSPICDPCPLFVKTWLHHWMNY